MNTSCNQPAEIAACRVLLNRWQRDSSQLLVKLQYAVRY